jgi:hypothetical protein
MNSTTNPPAEAFPARGHQEALRRKAKIRDGYDTELLTDDERWHWYAYLYGWRRIYPLNNERSMPTDPRGEWFNEPLTAKAAAMFAPEVWRPRPKPQISPADQAAHRGDLETAACFRQQDRERAAAVAKVTAERVTDASPTPEAVAFVALCVRQIKANMKAFAAASKAAFGGRGAKRRAAA